MAMIIMKKLIFILLCFSLMALGPSARIIEVAPAGAWGVLGISGGGAVVGGEETSYDHNLSLEENAGTPTAVNNSDTSKANWTCAHNTSTYHTANSAELLGAFDLNAEYRTCSSGENWTDEAFEVIVWIYLDALTANRVIFSISDTDASYEANEFYTAVYTGGEIEIGGNSGSTSTKLRSNNLSLSATTYYCMKYTINTGVSPWTVAVEKSTDCTNYTAATWGAWGDGNPAVATLNSPVRIGSSPNWFPGDIDHFRMRANP